MRCEGAQGRASEPGVILTVGHTGVRPGDYLVAGKGRVLDVQPCAVMVTLEDGRSMTLQPGVVRVERDDAERELPLHDEELAGHAGCVTGPPGDSGGCAQPGLTSAITGAGRWCRQRVRRPR